MPSTKIIFQKVRANKIIILLFMIWVIFTLFITSCTQEPENYFPIGIWDEFE